MNSDVASSQPTHRGWGARIQGLIIRQKLVGLYAISALFVGASFLLWYNFNSPPINSNIGFDIFPWRQVSLSGSAFNPYIWPGSYVPWILGAPPQAFYGTFFTASGQSYSFALFATVASIDIIGGVCLFYLLQRWLARFHIPAPYALFGVLIYAFNDYKLLSGFGTTDGYFSAGLLTAGDPAILLILTFLTYLSLFRGQRYLLVLGAFSFLAFSNFPTGTLILAQEYLAVLFILLGFRWASFGAIGLRPKLTQLAKQTGLVCAAMIAANAYIIYPFVLVHGTYFSALTSANPQYAFSYSFDTHQYFSYSLRLITNWSVFTHRAPPWAAAYVSNPLAVALSFVLPFLALEAILFLRRLSDLWMYGLMFAVLVLSTSINSPFSSSFVWLTTNVPPFRAFYNGETLTPILLLFYCTFAPITIARLVGFLNSRSWEPMPEDTRGAGASVRARVLGGRLVPKRLSEIVWPCLIAVLLLASVYPLLTPQYTQSHNEAYPIDSQLPAYYGSASSFLQARDPMGPTMVFPLVEPFDSNAINGSTWYYGIDLYPELIANPSVSSVYPDNYEGGDGNTLPIPGFIYGIGGSTCATPSCLTGGDNPIPVPSDIPLNQSPQYSTENRSLIQWQASFPSDNATFQRLDGNTSILFHVNSSVSESNGHWLLGFLPSVENLSEYAYAVINFSLNGTSPGLVQFGYHSNSEYGEGNGYFLGNYSALNSSSYETAIIPLDQPTIHGGGDLDQVTNLYFVDDSPILTGEVNLTIHSLQFTRELGDVAPNWKAGTLEDEVNLDTSGPRTSVDFRINESVFESNGHWALGYFSQPVNLSGYEFAVLNYTLVNLNPAYVQFGYHSGAEYGPGEGFDLPNYVTFNQSGRYSTLIPLDAPTVLGGGGLGNVTNLFLQYSPPGASPGFGYLNVSSLRFSHNDSGGALVLASALDRLGIEYAYVDTSIVATNFEGYSGDYYDTVFGESPYFSSVYHGGTVTIYQDRLYHGIITSPDKVEPANQENASLDDLSFPYASIYYDNTDDEIGYTSGQVDVGLANITMANITDIQDESATDYSIHASASGASVIELKTEFNAGWTARFSNGTTIPTHFELDGFANAWILPQGSFEITLSFTGAPEYLDIELTTLAIPPALAGLFVVIWWRRSGSQLSRSKQNAEPDEVGAIGNQGG